MARLDERYFIRVEAEDRNRGRTTTDGRALRNYVVGEGMRVVGQAYVQYSRHTYLVHVLSRVKLYSPGLVED